jgi:hypothetical protein
MKIVDFVAIVLSSVMIALLVTFGYGRIINAASVVSTKITPEVKVAEPPVLPVTHLQAVDNHGLVSTYNPQVVGENASNNWGQ